MENLERKRIGLVGAGAVGSFIGWKLMQAGVQVYFVARGNFTALSTNGLSVEADGGDKFTMPVQVIASLEHMPDVDAIVVATKTMDIDGVSQQIASHAPSATILAIHNGLSPESKYAAGDEERVLLGGVAYLTAQMTAPNVLHVHGDHRLVVGLAGRRDKHSSLIGEDLVAILRAAAINAEFSADIHSARWHKLAWSLVFAGPCTILDVDTHKLVHSVGIRQLLQRLFDEASTVAEKDNATLELAEFSSMIADAEESPGHLVSMTLDRRNSKLTEHDEIYGSVRRRGGEAGVPTPTIDAVHALLSCGEATP